MADLARARGEVVVPSADLAAAAGYPAGISQLHANGRLGTALWEIFPGHVALLDRDATVVSVNRAWRQFGLDNGAAATAGVGQNYLAVCDHAAAGGVAEAAPAAVAVRAAIAGTDPGPPLTYPLGLADAECWFAVQALPVPGLYSGALVIHTDVSTAHQVEADLTHRAFHVSLTGLPNRALLTDRLAHAAAGAARAPRSLAVLFLDIDAFKAVNDWYGHPVGDEVLCQVAARMRAAVRTSDTVGRWGGDEFLIVAEHLDADTTAAELAARVAAAVREPIRIDGAQLTVGVSVGVAHHSTHPDVGQLIAAADRALLVARQRRRGAPQETR